ncbi:MAG: hypothetical protein MUE72_14375, partial [Chitinophagaceae bacterium]|nr:hypothetical protein [Chitinophagaceae bacterium]
FSGKKDFIFYLCVMILKDFGYDFTRPNGNAERCKKCIWGLPKTLHSLPLKKGVDDLPNLGKVRNKAKI